MSDLYGPTAPVTYKRCLRFEVMQGKTPWVLLLVWSNDEARFRDAKQIPRIMCGECECSQVVDWSIYHGLGLESSVMRAPISVLVVDQYMHHERVLS